LADLTHGLVDEDDANRILKGWGLKSPFLSECFKKPDKPDVGLNSGNNFQPDEHCEQFLFFKILIVMNGKLGTWKQIFPSFQLTRRNTSRR